MFLNSQENEYFQKISCKLMNKVNNAQNFREIILIRLKNGKESPKIVCKNNDFDFRKDTEKKLIYQDINNLTETSQNTMNITEKEFIEYRSVKISNKTLKKANKTIKLDNNTVKISNKITNKTKKIANLTKNSILIKNAEDIETKTLLSQFKAQFIKELVQSKTSSPNKIIDFSPKYGAISGYFHYC